MASPHVAGAAALLASQGDTHQAIRDTLLGKGNFNWTDDSGDGILEPLLDIGDPVFAPVFVAAGGGSDTNAPPTAAFTSACAGLGCDFDGRGSSDSDGSIVSHAWDFGDGATASGPTASHTYATDGTYTVSLTVTDDSGASGTVQHDVTVASGGGGELLTSSQNNGSTWTAMVETADGFGLTGTWSYSGGTGGCSAGACTLGGIPKKVPSVDFTSGTGSTVTVFKP